MPPDAVDDAAAPAAALARPRAASIAEVVACMRAIDDSLAAFRVTPALADGFVRTLDRSTGMAGRGLLHPLPPVRRLLLDRLRRRFR